MILVTGGCGYIGSHTILKLAKIGYKIVILDNFSNSSFRVLDKLQSITNKEISFIEGDIRDYDVLRKIFVKYRIEEVLHFAALKSISESFQKSIEYFSNNIGGSLNLLNAMDEAKIKKIIFSSSATVYGKNHKLPWHENLKLSMPDSPYAQSKLVIEESLRNVYNSDNNWKVGILRYFNPIGAHSSDLINEDINGKVSNLIPNILKVIKNKHPFLEIYGNDYKTVDGTGVRDFIHIDDLVDGHIKALEYLSSNNGYNIWNLGTGSGYSVLQVLKEFEDIMKIKIPYRILDRRNGDLSEYWADPSKAFLELNWQAKKNIKEMVKDCIS